MGPYGKKRENMMTQNKWDKRTRGKKLTSGHGRACLVCTNIKTNK